MRKILKEPLLHFCLLGIAIFVLFSLAGNNQDDDTIVINENDVNHMVSLWELQWKREPTPQELSEIIYRYVQQEVFYREGIKMKLDVNDEVIKRRISQKMEFLSDDISAFVNNPTDEELEKYFQEHAVRYKTPYSYSFYQVVFSPDNHRNAYEKAREILGAFEDSSVETLQFKGDPLPFPFFFDTVTEDKIGKTLGSNLAESVRELEVNRWVGPVSSGFGYHLLYIVDRKVPQLPEFSSVKNEVLRDYTYDKEKDSRLILYREMIKKYELEFETKSLDRDLIEKIEKRIKQQV